MNNLKFSEFTDEFDIAKHFPFSQVFGFLFIFRCLRAHAVLILLRDWVSKRTKILCYDPTRRFKSTMIEGFIYWVQLFCLPVFKFISAFVEQKSSKCTRLFGNFRIEIWCFFIESFAQLCVHRRVFWFIESFFKYLELPKYISYYIQVIINR